MKVGMGADHGGFEMKQQLAKLLVTEGHEVVDFGNKIYDTNDDYPNFAILLARTLASGDMERAFWCAAGGAGVSVAANKVGGVSAGLCHDDYSARQGVEDDDMNVLCLGGRTMGIAVAWDCTKNFLGARFSGAAHRRRLAKVTQLDANTIAHVE